MTERLLKIMRSNPRVCILTGAGISKESGVPTFRDKDGLWSKFKPEELANVNAFIGNPKLVWEWYQWRRKLIRDVKPNPGHLALVTMEKKISDFTLVTQNVDNLHQTSGSKNVLELHGNIESTFCIDCRTPIETAKMQDYVKQDQLPHCPECNGYLRPGVVWFGEMLPADIYAKAEEASIRAQVFFTVGTSSVVHPAAGLPLIAKSSGAYVVEVNPEPTDISRYCDEVLQGPSGEILPELMKRLGFQ